MTKQTNACPHRACFLVQEADNKKSGREICADMGTKKVDRKRSTILSSMGRKGLDEKGIFQQRQQISREPVQRPQAALLGVRK